MDVKMRWWIWLILVLIGVNCALASIYVSRIPPVYMPCPMPGVLYFDGNGDWFCLPGEQMEI